MASIRSDQNGSQPMAVPDIQSHHPHAEGSQNEQATMHRRQRSGSYSDKLPGTVHKVHVPKQAVHVPEPGAVPGSLAGVTSSIVEPSSGAAADFRSRPWLSDSDDTQAEYLAAALQHREDVGADLNCFINCPPREEVQAQFFIAGRRPLQNVPFVVKDCLEVEGMITTGGMSHRFFQHCPAVHDAPVVSALRRAGALVIAKANLPDMHMGLSSDSSSFGKVKNPYDPSLHAIGSSGGIAAAVASGIVPFGIGTDTGGCLRIPSALCGVVGFRPSFERYNNMGMIHQSVTRDMPGPIARTVADIQLLDTILKTTQVEETYAPEHTGDISGPPSTAQKIIAKVQAAVESVTATAADVVKPSIGLCPLPEDFHAATLHRVRLGIPRKHYYEDLHPDVAEGVERVLQRVKAGGATLIEVDFPSDQRPWEIDLGVGAGIRAYEVLRELGRWIYEHGSYSTIREIVENFPGSKKDALMLRQQLSGNEAEGAVMPWQYRACLKNRDKLVDAFHTFFREHHLDGIVYPACPLPAAPLNPDGTVHHNGKDRCTYATYTRNTAASSNAGLPALAFATELGHRTKLPIGVEIAGARGSDENILAIGRAIQALLPALPPPRIHV